METHACLRTPALLAKIAVMAVVETSVLADTHASSSATDLLGESAVAGGRMPIRRRSVCWYVVKLRSKYGKRDIIVTK